MKIIAYYLPQYHEIEENNKWWGKGFTEWTNLKKSKPLFKGHIQPISPLNDNYYNILDKEIVQWQSELAVKYNVYGFCYYHYWFNGRKILEKPAENLLSWKDIDKKFCFCWANHSWLKTWNGSREILIKQDYGDEIEWESHFNYLIPFFKDKRYIKIDNKPLFMLYSPRNVENLDNRIQFYNEKCKEYGFDGIFILESINHKNFNSVSTYSSGVVIREPSIGITSSSLSKRVIHKIKSGLKRNYLFKPMKYDYETICKESLNFAKSFKCTKRVFLGSFTGWDSTPRHGRRGYIVTGSSIENFRAYLNEQKKIINENNIEEFVFLNAWNEWAEGMYLEPDNVKGYGLLDAIKQTID